MLRILLDRCATMVIRLNKIIGSVRVETCRFSPCSRVGNPLAPSLATVQDVHVTDRNAMHKVHFSLGFRECEVRILICRT